MATPVPIGFTEVKKKEEGEVLAGLIEQIGEQIGTDLSLRDFLGRAEGVINDHKELVGDLSRATTLAGALKANQESLALSRQMLAEIESRAGKMEELSKSFSSVAKSISGLNVQGGKQVAALQTLAVENAAQIRAMGEMMNIILSAVEQNSAFSTAIVTAINAMNISLEKNRTVEKVYEIHRAPTNFIEKVVSKPVESDK